MVAQKEKNGALKTSKVKVQIELDAQVNDLLGLMLHKAQISKSDLMQEFVARWISQNFDDLLSEAEQKPYRNLFYYAKKAEVMSC